LLAEYSDCRGLVAPECSVGRKADIDLGESMALRPEVAGYHVFSIVSIRSTEEEEEDPHLSLFMRFNITLHFILHIPIPFFKRFS